MGRIRWVRFALAVIVVVATATAGCGSDGGTDVDASAPTPSVPAAAAPPGPSGPTIPGPGDATTQAQAAADAAMTWVGEAYRLLTRDGKVSDAGLRQLAAGYSGRALAAEARVYRQYGSDPSALSTFPANPVLEVDGVIDQAPGCFVVRARFDENPILAFPVDSAGIDVVAVLRERDGFWKISTLARSTAAADERIDCSTT